jgi:hypothetical protein
MIGSGLCNAYTLDAMLNTFIRPNDNDVVIINADVRRMWKKVIVGLKRTRERK